MGVGSQHLAHIRLGYATLSRNLRRFDARFKSCTNGIQLPTRQRDRRRFLLPPVGRFGRSRRTVRGLIAWWQSAAPLHFLEDCRVEEVQFTVAQVLYGFT